MDLLKVEHVTKVYGSHKALDDVSLTVPQGTVYGLLGPNGAGKTTLIRIINHITAPDSGVVYFDGHPLVQADTAQIGYLPEERGLYKKMKVGEQAIFFARLKGMSAKEAEKALRQWFEKLDIISWWSRPVEELSKGMAQKVQFIVTVLHRPKLLIFDEPFSGFDPINANLLREEILNLKREGSTIIFSTHNMASVEEICEDITLINNGHNILTGNVEQIRRRFTDGRYEISFDGSAADFTQSIASLVAENEITTDPSGKLNARIKLAPGATLRSVIEATNPVVYLRNVNEAMSSMNDIFINAVNHSNYSSES